MARITATKKELGKKSAERLSKLEENVNAEAPKIIIEDKVEKLLEHVAKMCGVKIKEAEFIGNPDHLALKEFAKGTAEFYQRVLIPRENYEYTKRLQENKQ